MRVGLAGAGRVGEIHLLRTLIGHPAVSEVRLYDPDRARAAALADAHGARAIAGFDQLLDGIDHRSVAGFDLSVELETQEAVLVAGNRRPVSEKPELVTPSAVLDFRDRFADAYHSELDAFVALARGVGPDQCDLQEAVRTHVLVAAARTALLERRVTSLSPQWTGQADGTE